MSEPIIEPGERISTLAWEVAVELQNKLGMPDDVTLHTIRGVVAKQLRRLYEETTDQNAGVYELMEVTETTSPIVAVQVATAICRNMKDRDAYSMRYTVNFYLNLIMFDTLKPLIPTLRDVVHHFDGKFDLQFGTDREVQGQAQITPEGFVSYESEHGSGTAPLF